MGLQKFLLSTCALLTLVQPAIAFEFTPYGSCRLSVEYDGFLASGNIRGTTNGGKMIATGLRDDF